MTATILARDQHCTFPGCRPAPRYTDLDHITAREDGDPTTTANLTSPCHRHHHLKHTGEWTLHRDDHTATTTWTDRKGREYQSRPPTVPTTATSFASPTVPAEHGPFDADRADRDANLDPPPF